jgi:dihydropteroate synthase
MPIQNWEIHERSFEWGKRTYLMGVVNVTPDSFSDGGEFATPINALAQAQKLVEAGADIVDIGGQSTRPGAIQISVDEELERVLSVIEVLRKEIAIPISIDTTRAVVAKAAVNAGADIVNDISGGTFDREMFATVACLDIPIVLMHLRGTPETMQQMTDYQNLLGEIYQFLERQIASAIASRINPSKIIIDPGIGFAKNQQQNLEILRNVSFFKSLNCPILVGASRKSFIGRILDRPDPKDRVWGTAAACCAAISTGADILRVHDVAQMRDVCRVADAIFRQT